MAQSHAERDFAAEDRYHRREWRMQRIGWALLVLILAAAIGGLFGEGLFSAVTLSSDDGSALSYERFARYRAKSMVTVRASAEANTGSEIAVSVSRSYLDAFEILSISPEPARTQTTSDEVMFFFGVQQAPADIVLRLEPDEIGSRGGTVRIGATTSLPISQFIYP